MTPQEAHMRAKLKEMQELAAGLEDPKQRALLHLMGNAAKWVYGELHTFQLVMQGFPQAEAAKLHNGMMNEALQGFALLSGVTSAELDAGLGSLAVQMANLARSGFNPSPKEQPRIIVPGGLH